MAQQINAVENPIINSPYEEPKHHWHIEEGKQPHKQDGRRHGPQLQAARILHLSTDVSGG